MALSLATDHNFCFPYFAPTIINTIMEFATTAEAAAAWTSWYSQLSDSEMAAIAELALQEVMNVDMTEGGGGEQQEMVQGAGSQVDKIDIAEQSRKHGFTPPYVVKFVCDNIGMYTIDEVLEVQNAWFFEKKDNSLLMAKEKMRVLKLQYYTRLHKGYTEAAALFLDDFKVIACEEAARCQDVTGRGCKCMNKVNYGSMLCCFHINKSLSEKDAMERHISNVFK